VCNNSAARSSAFQPWVINRILARQILISHNVPLDRVTMLPLGTSDMTYVALEAETIDATMVQIPQFYRRGLLFGLPGSGRKIATRDDLSGGTARKTHEPTIAGKGF
jgi:hypothetical protein